MNASLVIHNGKRLISPSFHTARWGVLQATLHQGASRSATGVRRRHAMLCHAMLCLSVGTESVGTKSVGAESVGTESVGAESVGAESVGAESHA